MLVCPVGWVPLNPQEDCVEVGCAAELAAAPRGRWERGSLGVRLRGAQETLELSRCSSEQAAWVGIRIVLRIP